MIKPTFLRRVAIAALLSGSCFSAAAAPPPPPVSYGVEEDVFHPVRAKQGMVASVDATATQVGVDILKEGGNAVDAAVAVGYALAVTHPQAGNLGGGGFMLIRSKNGNTTAIDFREMAPAKATRDMFLDDQGNPDSKKSLLITKEDLAAYKAVERTPISGDYRGYQVYSMPPPSSGGIHIVQILNILENFDMQKYGFGSADAMQIMAEAEKYAYADRSEYLGDPDFVKVPWQALTNKAYAKSIAEQIDINKAKPSSEIRPGKLAPYESNQTTHYSVVDKDGNAVAVTYTLNTTFGTGIVAGDSGILLNNQMDDFSAKPGVPNVYGLVGGDANAVGPNKRPLSSMSPTIVVKDGKTWLVTGSPGGSRIITTVLQMVVNSIDYGMNVAEATNAPRFHHQWLPDELRVEKGFSPDTLKLLEAKGQKVALKEAMGSTQSIMVGPDGELYGASDPRSVDDLTAGY
ncbi:gamma-glutamyltransferase [Escherichia coli]|nr:gamma-glutamyltransferase [Escherichia coli]